MNDEEEAKNIAGTIVQRTRKLERAGRYISPLSGTRLAATLNSVSSVAPWIEQTPILSLEKTFQQLSDAELHVYANDDQAIGPRIGVTAIPEPTLKALANFVVERRNRKGERIWWVVATIASAVIGAVAVAWIK